ncbi:MAG: 4-hydroxy-3-methylbut-2-enyl diphosphate reductase [Armatimonadetes bacterium]|nr:4-hydroxy-3-methylbut-2-enyl diphosphate reductase [Armatimonadota bacterium]
MKIVLASPRGFCAGVERAIDIVDIALEVYGPPVYVRKEIVHNQYVVEDFRRRGVVFVDSIEEVPVSSVVVFSAHGVSPAVWEEAQARNLNIIDATCPLVTKVHLEVHRFVKDDYDVVLIGHEGHDEVIGTMGEAPDRVMLVGSVEEARSLVPPRPDRLVYLTQTTLSVDETREIVAALKERFPSIAAPPKDDICYATQNRQDAVKAMAEMCEVILVLGSANSSNSVRLSEVAETHGARGYRIDNASEINPQWLQGVECVGVTAGASTPEILVQTTIDRLKELGADSVETLRRVTENMKFALPRKLVEVVRSSPDTIHLLKR